MNRENLPKANAECIICGRKYYRCARCIELRNRGIESWKLKCDSVECFSVHVLIENAKKGNVTEDLLNELNGIELADGREFTNDTLATISKLNTNVPDTEHIEETIGTLAKEIFAEEKIAISDRKARKRSRNQVKAKNVK